MTLHPPFCISARLMPGLKVGGAYISLGNGPRNAENRTQYQCFIDLPDGTEHEITDLASGCGGGTVQGGFESLLTFLGAAAESYKYNDCDWSKIDREDNATLFPQPVTEWAYENSDEISVLEIEISENPNLIEN